MSKNYGQFLSSIIENLDARETSPILTPTDEWSAEITEKIQSSEIDDLFEDFSITDRDFAECVRSGVLLWNDALDESHTISQKIDTKTGSYWHGIMHRREPDYNNSKYWFRRVGDHPIFSDLRDLAIAIANRSEGLKTFAESIETKENWDAFQFIDWCKSAVNRDDPISDFLRSVQLAEIKLLLDYSLKNAGA